jgi:hypothetical protein
MNDLIITVDRDTRKVKLNRGFIGLNGENLQGNIIVDFTDKADFIDGVAFLEVDRKGDKRFIEMEQDAENKAYKLPIKESLLKYACAMKCQVTISQSSDSGETPKFRTEIFEVSCLEAINATEQIPDDYPKVWSEQVNETLTEHEETMTAQAERIEELNNADEQTNERIDGVTADTALLQQALLQAGLLYKADTEATYNERATAGGANVLNGSKAVLKKVKGATVNGVNAWFGGIRCKSKNIFYPLKDRTEISTVGIGDISALEFSETAYYKGFSGGQYIDSNAVREMSIDGDSLTFMSGRDYYGIGFFIPVLGNKDITISWGTQHTNYRVSVTQLGADKTITKTQQVAGGQYSSMFVHTEENTAWLMLVIQPNYRSSFQSVDISNIQVEYDSTATEYAPYGVSSISFPRVELPDLKTIDFEQKVIIDYSQSPVSVIPFTEEQKAVGNEYAVYSGGTEAVIENDGAESGALPTLTQKYLIVKGG